MQGSKSNFFAKSEKSSRFDDDNWTRKGSGGTVKNREKMDKNKQARRQANRQDRDE